VAATGVILAFVLDDDDTVALAPMVGPTTGAVARLRF